MNTDNMRWKKEKAYIVTTIVFALLASVLFFIYKTNEKAFVIPLSLFAVYGFASTVDDFCRWMIRDTRPGRREEEELSTSEIQYTNECSFGIRGNHRQITEGR